jgi:single-strand DNA-binding protein
MNNCTFAGRVGQDATLRKTSGDQSVSSFSIAVNRFKKDAGPLWVKVTLWGKQADSLTQYISKGKEITVSGEVDLQTYETRDGEKRTDLVLNARQVTLHGSKDREAGDENDTSFPS